MHRKQLFEYSIHRASRSILPLPLILKWGGPLESKKKQISHISMWINSSSSINHAFATISIITSFHESMGPGRHQCRQSFWTLAFSSWAKGWNTRYGPGCPSGLDNKRFVKSRSLNFTPFLFASLLAFPNSFNSIPHKIPFRSFSSTSPSLAGVVLQQVPPLCHSPFSKWSGVDVLKKIKPLWWELDMKFITLCRVFS